MAKSQNGYPANDISLTSNRFVPGTTRKMRVRNGAAGDLLLWVAGQFDKLVEDIEQGILDDWGYAERDVRGGSDLSNHASGTAIDLNATAHPLATAPASNFSAQEIANIRAIVARTKGCVRWGGDYTGRKDGMHFEINASEDACRSVLASLNASQPPPIREEDMPLNKDDLNAIGNVVTNVMKYRVLATTHEPGDPDNWTFDGQNLVDMLRGMRASMDAFAAAIAAATANSAITPEFVTKTVQDAVKQSLSITGTVNIGPAVQA